MLKKVGVLALQGGFALHVKAFEKLGAACVLIKNPGQLSAVEALVLPGGESTALQKLMNPLAMQAAIQIFVAKGRAVFATCCGIITLAQLGLLDVSIERNAYGRQLDSKVVLGKTYGDRLGMDPLTMPFIRAPKITAYGDGVDVLASFQDDAVLVQQNHILAATFHPELADDLRVARYFLDHVMSHKKAPI